ncbi:MAG: WD40 repeat domain-containing protein [bacterium]|nr:WD40 repeat domain-containing protein [bacterium]
MKMLQLLVLFVIVLFFGLSEIDSQTNQDIGIIEWSHDGSKLAIGYRNGMFRIFRSSDMAILFEQLTTDTAISSLAWSPSDTKLAIGYYLDRVDIWDIVSFQKVLTLFTGSSQNNRLIWGEDSNTLFVSDGADIPTVKFDANTGIVLDSYSAIYSYLIPLKNNDVFINYWYDTVYSINSDTMLVIDEFTVDNEFGRIFTIQVSPYESVIAIGSIYNKIHILDIETLDIIATLDGGELSDEGIGIIGLAFNETGSRLFTVTRTGTIRSWDTSTWQMIQNIELNYINRVDFPPDASQVTYGNLEQGSQIFMQDLCDFVAPDVTSLLAILPQANTFGEEAQICLTENGQYDLTASLPNITEDVAIIGNGASITMTGGAQIFNVAETGGLTLKNVTVSGGNAVQGGAIFNAGTLVLEDVVLENNSATDGGAIYNTGSLTMRGGAIQNNTATNFGGGIYNVGEMDLDGVNIRDNDAVAGSGVYQGE